MTDLKIYNEFGIVPSSNCDAAGLDFYVPNIVGLSNRDAILAAFAKSYKTDVDALGNLLDELALYVSAKFTPDVFENNELNILHLFLALDSKYLNDVVDDERVSEFVYTYLMFDKNGKPGIQLMCNDHVCFNSGIKVALDNDTAGIFFNKSGKGNKGFDVRACVVDEDYAGFVHTSLSYTKDDEFDGAVFCGDKITQMVVLPIIHKKCVEVSKDEYEETMSNSRRGSNAFGSSDEKH